MKWGVASVGVDGAVAFLRKTATAWSIPPRTVDSAAQEIRGLIDRMEDLDPLDRGGELRLSTDGIDFRAEISFPGAAPATTIDESVLSMLPAYAIDTEEAAVVAGMKTFLESSAAERKEFVPGKGGPKVILTYGG
jgi:hypothetical protein